VTIENRDFDESRLYLPDPLTVTLTRPASYSGGGQVNLTVLYVQEQPLEEQSVASPMGAGSLEGTKTRFRMWLVECLSLPPHRGYLIRKADASVWHVDRVETLCKGRQFRCHCTRRPS
jgi:hypothetical protein